MNNDIREVIPTCNILGVNIAAVNMDWTLNFFKKNIKILAGNYVCVSNVHTTVTSYIDADYCRIQNSSILSLPDGGPLSTVGRKKGYSQMYRVTGPDLMEEIFKVSEDNQYKHYFYGSSEKTLEMLKKKLKVSFPNLEIVGMYSPPFRELTTMENELIIKDINSSNPDFIWIGLGAPKQEKWMASQKGKLNGLMIGVGAGFDYHAGNIRRAPKWIQHINMEWLYRLIQDPKRLFSRYLKTNTRFLWLILRGK